MRESVCERLTHKLTLGHLRVKDLTLTRLFRIKNSMGNARHKREQRVASRAAQRHFDGAC